MPDSFSSLLVDLENHVATVRLNRPELHNAFNETLIRELHTVFDALSDNAAVRVVRLTGQGPSFCAGADLNWMKRMREATRAENIADAERLDAMLMAIVRCKKPVLVEVNGTTLGGGLGLVAAADISFAHSGAVFGLSEVRLGLIPAVISPFVLKRIGAARFRELALTAERFSASQALEWGLVHYAEDPEKISSLIDTKIRLIKMGGPQALEKTKELVEAISEKSFSETSKITAEFLAERRASLEGREGIDAFFEKRKPSWMI